MDDEATPKGAVALEEDSSGASDRENTP